MKDCMGLAKEMVGQHDELPLPAGSDVQFIFLRLNVLREYLIRELTMQNLPFAFDIEVTHITIFWLIKCRSR